MKITNGEFELDYENNGCSFSFKGECQSDSEEESCKSVKCHHHGSCAMKNVSLKESVKEIQNIEEEEDVIMEPYCRCPLGFHGEFCEKAVDVQVKEW
jgi:hypothetical protein